MPSGMVSGVCRGWVHKIGAVIIEGEGADLGDYWCISLQPLRTFCTICESDALFPNNFGEDLLELETC